MSRWARVTHSYLLNVPEDDLEAFDSIMNAGVSMVEKTLKGAVRNAREVRSEWELLAEDDIQNLISVEGSDDVTISRGRVPRTYAQDRGVSAEEAERDSILSKQIIEADLDQGITFVADVMGQRPGAMHPWDQGLSIFPEDHPLHWIEQHFREKNDKEALERLQASSPKLKEIE